MGKATANVLRGFCSKVFCHSFPLFLFFAALMDSGPFWSDIAERYFAPKFSFGGVIVILAHRCGPRSFTSTCCTGLPLSLATSDRVDIPYFMIPHRTHQYLDEVPKKEGISLFGPFYRTDLFSKSKQKTGRKY